MVNPGGVDRGPVGPVSSQAEVIRARDAVDIAGCSSTWQPASREFVGSAASVVTELKCVQLAVGLDAIYS